jgi:F-type H+-transporting ATPase subunit a
MTKIYSPLEHFELNIFSFLYIYIYDFSLNSGSLYLLSLIFFFSFLFFTLRKNFLLETKAQIIYLNLYEFILTIFKQQVHSTRALRFFPFIFSLFFFIFILNFSSLFIFGVSLTGHILITAYLSFSIFISLFLYGLLNYDKKFFQFFVPNGVPKVLLDFIILIEIFSFAIRPFSLSIRLFANMLAGHTLMGIFSKFCIFTIQNFLLLALVPYILVILVLLLEVAVAVIQAYIFVSLVCIYLNDVLNLH